MSNDLKAFVLSLGGSLAVVGFALLVLWGGAGMAGLRIPPGCYQTDRPNCVASPS
jgi:hypothetical protein